MTAYRPNRRDPLTYRSARGVRDTITDPYDYSEGPTEPQFIVPSEKLDPADSLIVRWGPLVTVAVIIAILMGWV